MARSTKTKHVMDLVGAQPVKKTAHPPKPAEKPAPPPVIQPVQEEPEHRAEPVVAEPIPAEAEPVAETAKQTAAELPPEEPKQNAPRITAVVCELINQELLNVAERFKLKPTDSNLWELTRAALEEVRPEFALDSDELNEKLERLRPKVIKSMTKAAIKVSAKGRNN